MLHFKEEYLKDIISGRKRITIRYGRNYDVRPGNTVVLTVRGRPVARAKITSVQAMKLRDLTERHVKMEGFRSLADLLQYLRRIYPRICLDSCVTVMEWEPLP